MARSSEDWRRLVVLCGLAGVAVVDEQRIYDPNDHDDKLLLELKGTMSEAEIHWLRRRLQGARQHKARRGRHRPGGRGREGAKRLGVHGHQGPRIDHLDGDALVRQLLRDGQRLAHV